MAKATYHNEALDGKEFDIITKNQDGTVDIGTGKDLVVKACPVSKDGPKIGHVTFPEEKTKTKE